MRLMNHKLLVIAVLVGIALINSPAMATNVGGIIDTDTTWDLAGSPYVITSIVQIAEGVNLTVEPGVLVNGDNKLIEVFGTLNVLGEKNSLVTFNNLEIVTSTNGVFNLAFAEYISCKISLTSSYTCQGVLNLSDSILRDGSYIILRRTGGDCFIDRNIFLNAGGIAVGTDQAYNVYIRNNVFYEQIWNGCINDQGNPGQTFVQYNSFLSTDRVALSLNPNYPSEMVAINNFWNTTDPAIIESMIYDRNDDLNVINYIEYMPILTEPHPDTPIPNFNQAPTSDCGTDQEFFDEVAFEEVTLDGSASSDPDGSIVSYDWTLQHRTKPDNDKSATGVNPTVTGLSNGFYEVCLTVTDNLGATNTDCSLLAAAGSCFCTPSKMHIESITAGINKGKYGKVTVSVFDDCGSTIPGAEVRGTFSGDFNETGSGVTDANGVAVINTTAAVSKPSYTFCVDDVVKGSLIYEPDDNVETCESK